MVIGQTELVAGDNLFSRLAVREYPAAFLRWKKFATNKGVAVMPQSLYNCRS